MSILLTENGKQQLLQHSVLQNHTHAHGEDSAQGQSLFLRESQILRQKVQMNFYVFQIRSWILLDLDVNWNYLLCTIITSYPAHLCSEQSDSKPLPDNAIMIYLSTTVCKEKNYPRILSVDLIYRVAHLAFRKTAHQWPAVPFIGTEVFPRFHIILKFILKQANRKNNVADQIECYKQHIWTLSEIDWEAILPKVST